MKGVLSRIHIGILLLLGKPPIPKGVRVGKSVHIGAGVRLDNLLDGALIDISDEVTIADGVQVICHDASGGRRTGGTWVAPVRIGARAFIGVNAILLPGVTIGADSIVGAGSVVTTDVKPHSIVAGAPAVQIGSVEETDKRRALEMQSIPIFESSVYAKPNLSDDRKRQLLDAAEKNGGFFLIGREVFESYQRGIR